jgi:hypothetical protein
MWKQIALRVTLNFLELSTVQDANNSSITNCSHLYLQVTNNLQWLKYLGKMYEVQSVKMAWVSDWLLGTLSGDCLFTCISVSCSTSHIFLLEDSFSFLAAIHMCSAKYQDTNNPSQHTWRFSLFLLCDIYTYIRSEAML